MDLLKQISHGQASLVIGEPLESVEDFPSHDFLASARNQPMVEEDRGSRVSQSANANFNFPEASLKLFPISLVRILNIRSCFEQSLEHKILDQISRRKLGATSIQRLENLLSVLVNR
jgi:hypothetical protein